MQGGRDKRHSVRSRFRTEINFTQKSSLHPVHCKHMAECQSLLSTWAPITQSLLEWAERSILGQAEYGPEPSRGIQNWSLYWADEEELHGTQMTSHMESTVNLQNGLVSLKDSLLLCQKLHGEPHRNIPTLQMIAKDSNWSLTRAKRQSILPLTADDSSPQALSWALNPLIYDTIHFLWHLWCEHGKCLKRPFSIPPCLSLNVSDSIIFCTM